MGVALRLGLEPGVINKEGTVVERGCLKKWSG